jgi:alpha-tubulin suppressor-like RCC1 family protein/GH43 family beta-xylosidase
MKKLLFMLLFMAGTIINASAQCWQSFTSGNYHALAIKTNGTLWAWGTNGDGQVGDGTTVSKLSPVQIGTGNTWKSVSAGTGHSIAVKSDGTLWAWGRNTNGQLGDGTNVSRSVPIQVGSATDWSFVGTGDNHSLAIKTDGTLWACGLNSNSQLGDGTTVDKNTFIQVGTGTNWKFVEGGESFTLAIQTDGTLWGFGYNSSYSLGDGTNIQRSTPVQIGSATNWATVASGQAFSIGVKTDGTLWSWGGNFEGALGAGTTSSRPTPTQVGTATDWKAVGACYRHSLATKTDGTLWGCGYNATGQLGDGTTVNKNVFTQVGIATNWLSPDAGSFHSIAIQSDATIWGTGSNNSGALGDGTNVSKTNPVQAVTTCLAGAALNFDGTNDRVALGNFSITGNGARTVEFWMKTTTTGVAQNPFSSGNQATSQSFNIKVLPTGNIGLMGFNNDYYPTSGITVADGAFHHIAITYDGTTAKAYVDGVLDWSRAIALNTSGTLNYLGISNHTGNEQYFTGTIDEVRIWNVARTKCEINAYKNCEIATSATGLLANYHFNQGVALSPNAGVTSLTDASGNSYTGTLTNFALTGSTSNWVAPGGVTSGNTTPIAAVSGTTVVTNVACFGGNTGAINLTPTGGTGPYTFNWLPSGPTTEDRTNLVAGTYSVQVTDANGCVGTVTVTVTQPTSPVSGTTVVTNVACFGGNNGAINLTPTGGTGPYIFNWLPSGPTTEDRTNLVAGTYSVQVTDANGCTGTVTVTVTQPTSPVSGTKVVTNVACFGGNTGAINLTPTGGIGPYTFNWLPSGPTTEDRTNLVAGTYSVQVTDANGCTGTVTVTVTQPTSPVSGTTVVTNVACFGGNTGAINLTPTGGTGPYTFNWLPSGPTTEDRTGLVAGTYSVQITDANGCTGTVTATVNQPTAPVSGTTVVTNVSCFSGNNGAINLTPAGGAGPYTFNWLPSGPTSEDRVNLVAGTYSVQITDANGCTGTTTVTVTQPTSPVSGTTVVTNVACFGGSNGAINLTPAGGTPGYTFNWGGGVTTEDRTSLAAGTYTVIETDANGCTGTVTVSVTQPTSPVSGTTVVTNVACFSGNTGAINLTPTGGTGPYTFNWLPSGPTTEDRTGLVAGTYSVQITDANGCTGTVTVSVTQPTAPVSGTTVVTNVACFGGNTGAINLTPTGGTGPYTFNWLPSGPTTEDRTGLVAGTYSVQITDANGCTGTVTVSVTQPTAPVSGTTVVTNVACFGGNTGAINLTPTGGTGPYTFNWLPSGPTSEDRVNLVAGTYSVQVTDANGCVGTVTASVTQPTAPVSGTTVVTNVSCFGGSNGAINLTPSGGTAPYTFNWLPSGPTTEDRTGLTQGTYSVQITDANGCAATVTATVSQPFFFIQPMPNVTNVSCFGGSNGSIDMGAFGGTPPYTYSWSNSATTEDLSGLTAGTYTVIITDANGCTAASSPVVSEPAQIVSTVNAAQCDTYTLNGSTYTASGTYTQLLTAANGCDSTLTLNLTITNSSASSLSQVACSSYTLNGTTYTASGTYTQTLTNAAGCDSIITLSLTVNQPTTSTLTEVACSSYTLNGTTYTSSGIYTQSLTNMLGCDSTLTLDLTIHQPTTSTLTEVACGSYTLNGTTYTSSGIYTQNLTNMLGCDSTLTLDLTIHQPTSSTLTEVTCSSYALNGTTYTASGTYTQTLTNAAGCDSTITLSLTVNQPTSSTLTEVTCSSYTLNGTTYTSSGTYAQTLVNAAGCDSTITLNLTVNQPTSSTLTETACGSYTFNGTNYTASGTYMQTLTNAVGCDSIITLNLTINTVDAGVTQNGGTFTANAAGLTYQWVDCDNGNQPLNGETNQSFTPQYNGLYAVMVSDGTCSAMSSCVYISNVGLRDNKAVASDVSIMPNPNSGSFTIKAPEGTYYLINELGQQVKTIVLNTGNANSIRIEQMSTGVYYLVGKDNLAKAKIVVTE